LTGYGITSTLTSPGRGAWAIVSAAFASGSVREINGATAIRPELMSPAARAWGERIEEGEAKLDLAKQQIERLDRHSRALWQHSQYDDPSPLARQPRRSGDRFRHSGAF
jgi:hypothetical protein